MKINAFDELLTEVEVAQMKIFSNQTECDAIYQVYSMGLFLLTTLRLSPNTI